MSNNKEPQRYAGQDGYYHYIIPMPVEAPRKRQEEHAGGGSYPTSGSVVAERVVVPKSD